MKITYKLTPDRRYFSTVVDRYYQQKPLLLQLHVQFGLLAALPALALAYGFGTHAPWAPGAVSSIILFAATCAGAMYLTKALILRRLLRSKDLGIETTIVVSTEGLTTFNSRVQSKIDWGAYPRSVRYPDGILLLRAKAIRWLPDSALRDSSPELATSLVQSQTVSRQVG
jgi:hypothetical protein